MSPDLPKERMRCALSRYFRGVTSPQVLVGYTGPKDLWHVLDGLPRLYKIVSTVDSVQMFV